LKEKIKLHDLVCYFISGSTAALCWNITWEQISSL